METDVLPDDVPDIERIYELVVWLVDQEVVRQSGAPDRLQAGGDRIHAIATLPLWYKHPRRRYHA